jgi:anaerobic selenocysteine-containing dehydrogenase
MALPSKPARVESPKLPFCRSGTRGGSAPRCEGKWPQVSLTGAMDEIADRLKTIVYRHGPEAISGTDGAIVPYGSTLRFLNTLGSPNLDPARAHTSG